MLTNVKPQIVLVLLAVLAAGCGGHSAVTRLTIQSGDSAYDLSCDPPRGTVADPPAVCHALAREPELLVGGPGIEHSCPQAPSQKVVGVRGQYRGYDVAAVFTDDSCGWTPGQNGAHAEWLFLLHGSGPGRRVTTSPSTPPHIEARRARALRRAVRKLVQQRKASLDTRLDDLALKIIRGHARLGVLEGGPLVAREEVFRAPRRKLERLLGYRSSEPDRPVLFVVTRYAYRDYAGRKHVATDGLSWAILDARTLDLTDFGLGGLPSLPKLGRPVTLDF